MMFKYEMHPQEQMKLSCESEGRVRWGCLKIKFEIAPFFP